MDKVSIIVTTYLPKSKRYLDLCIKSIQNLEYNGLIEIIIVSHSNYQPQYLGVWTICPHERDFYPAEGINYGMKQASPDSKYFMIVNDDVILTKHSLTNLIEMVGDNPLMANAISPCDNGIAYNLTFGFQKDDGFVQMLGRAFKYEELENDLPELMNAQSIYPRGFVRQPFLCIYATIIPRKLYDAVGDWDENFKTGQDDLDYSLRAHQKGFQTISVLDALVWHFGGVTVESTLNLDIRKQNVKYFRDKWGFMPPGIPESFLEL